MGKVKAVPDGYATVTPFFNIKGAAAAIELYKKAFDAKEQTRIMTPEGKVAMCELKIGTSMVRISDSVAEPPTQSSTQLYVDDADVIWKRALAAGCEAVLPLEDRPFGDRFGILKDPYGNRWSIATHIRDVPREEIQKMGAEASRVH